MMFTSRQVGVGVGLVALTFGAAPAMAGDSPGGRLTVSVKNAQDLKVQPSIAVVQAMGQADARTVRVRGSQTVTGLEPGLYAIKGPKAVTVAGVRMQPAEPVQWVTVQRKRPVRVKVRYVRQSLGEIVIVSGIRVGDACKHYNGDDWKAAYRSLNDPMSWYCYQDGDDERRGVDLTDWCKVRWNDPRNFALLNGNRATDWLCVFRR